jgi:hypothetical protein
MLKSIVTGMLTLASSVASGLPSDVQTRTAPDPPAGALPHTTGQVHIFHERPPCRASRHQIDVYSRALRRLNAAVPGYRDVVAIFRQAR